MKHSSVAAIVVVVLLACLVLPTRTWAQHGQDALLAGTIRDSSGGVMTSATVTVTGDRLIGGSRATATDVTGAYRFAFLPPGRYTVTAETNGFSPITRADVTLVPGLEFTMDFVLHPAAVSESTAVQGAAPLVDVKASSSPALIDRRLLQNLPLSRSVSDAVNLAPGVVRDVAFGGTVLSNPLSLDGASGNEPGFGVPIVQPNLHWIDELQIVSIGAGAQYGEYTGALENAIVRSGTNTFSGLGSYWTTRTDWTGDNRGSLAPAYQERFRPLSIVSRWDGDAQLGGPLRRDRLWIFGGGEVYRDANVPVSFTGVSSGAAPVTDLREYKGIVKLTAAPAQALRAEGFVSHVATDATNINAAQLVTPEALAVSSSTETMWNARLLWTMNPRAFLEFAHGGHHYASYFGPPPDRRTGPPAHIDQLTGVASGNVVSVSDYVSRPISGSVKLTLFTGGHDLRAGFEYEHDHLYDRFGYTGDRIYNDVDGAPYQVEIWGGATYRPDHTRRTVYAQDAWSVTRRLTINAGLRVGFYTGAVPGHPEAFSAHSIAPRIGAAFDVTGHHTTVARMHYGRYHDEMVTSFYDFLDPLSQTPDIVFDIVDAGLVEVFRYPSAAQASIAPGIRFPFVEEYLAGLERQLGWGLSAMAQYIHRDFKSSIGFTDPARVWRPVDGIDPGPDGLRRTADDGGTVQVFVDANPGLSAPVLTNPPAYRRYRGMQFVVRKRDVSGLAVQASYTWSRTVGNYNNASFSNAANNDLGTNGVFVNPNRTINTEGRTPQDFPHEVKVLATWHAAPLGGVNLSGVYRYQSGRLWARSAGGFGATGVNAIFMEPRGTRTTAAVNVLDLRAEKTFRVGPATPGFFVDVFNVGNQGVALNITNQSGPNLGVPVRWSDPRTLRLGLRVSF